MRTTPSARRRARRIIRRDRLKVSATQSARLRMFASLLDVRPQDLVEWLLADHIKVFNDPRDGILTHWARKELVYDSPEQAARTIARVEAWVDRRSAAVKGGAQ